jgi:hypothetical protein
MPTLITRQEFWKKRVRAWGRGGTKGNVLDALLSPSPVPIRQDLLPRAFIGWSGPEVLLRGVGVNCDLHDCVLAGYPWLRDARLGAAGTGSSRVFREVSRAGPSRGVALCYRSSAIPGRSLRMKPPLGLLPTAPSSAAQGHPPHWTYCPPHIGRQRGVVVRGGQRSAWKVSEGRRPGGQFPRSEGSRDATRAVDRCLPRTTARRTKVAVRGSITSTHGNWKSEAHALCRTLFSKLGTAQGTWG